MVRSQLASSGQRWDADDAMPILGRLARHDEDLRDPHIPNLLWWAFERQLRQDRDAVIELLSTAEMQRTAAGPDAILERTARALVSEGSDGDFAACARLLAAAPGTGADGAAPGRDGRGAAGPKAGAGARRRWPSPMARLWAAAQPAPGVVLIRLAARMGSSAAIAAAVDQARDPRAADADRTAMIELLGQLGRPEDLPVIMGILRTRRRARRSSSPRSRRWGAIADRRPPGRCWNAIPRPRPAVRARILGLLCTRREWAEALLDAIEQRQIAAKDLTPAHVQLIAQLSDPALLARLEAAWGKVPRVGSPEKKQRIAEIRGLLPEGDKGNAARGKPIFKENCAVCHKLFGEGESIGPELTGSERGDLDFLMTSLVDPSSLVRKEYQAQTIALRDGRVLTGLVVEEDDRTLTLVDGNRQKTVVARDAVEAGPAVGGLAHARRAARQADRAADPRPVPLHPELGRTLRCPLSPTTRSRPGARTADTLVGWVKPTGAGPARFGGFTHPTDSGRCSRRGERARCPDAGSGR